MEANFFIGAGGTVVMFLLGVIVVSLRNTLERIQGDVKELYSRTEKTARELHGLQATHNAVMDAGAHRRRADHGES
jgi:uncharacterized membrane protein YccC